MKYYLPFEIQQKILSFIQTKCVMCNKQNYIFYFIKWNNKYGCPVCINNLELLML